MRVKSYGVAVLAGLLIAGGFMIVRRPSAPPPPRGEVAGEALPRAPQASTAEPDARSARDEPVRDLGSQMLVETSVLEALRDQVEQAQQELAVLEQQKTAARAAIDGLQRRQQDAARAVAAKPPTRLDPQRPAPQAEPVTPRQPPPAEPVTPRQAPPAESVTPRQAPQAELVTPRQAPPAESVTPRQAPPAELVTPRQSSQAEPVTPPPAQATGEWVVARQAANVRAAPLKDAAIQRTAPAGAVLRVYGRSRDGWVQVGEDSAWGWIYSGLLDPAR